MSLAIVVSRCNGSDKAEEITHLGMNNISPGQSIVSENLHSFATDSGKRSRSSPGALRSILLSV